MLAQSTSNRNNALNDFRKDFLGFLTLAFLVLLTGGGLLAIGLAVSDPTPPRFASVGLVVFTYAATFFMGWQLRRGKIDLAASVFTGVSVIVSLSILGLAVSSGELDLSLSGTYTLAAINTIIIAAAVGSRVLYILTSTIIISTGVIAAVIVNMTDAATGFTPITGLHITTLSAIGIVTVATRYFISVTARANEQALRTTNLLEASAQVGQIMAKQLNLDELLNDSVELIQDRFAFYHAQVFLIDEQHEYANLVASTGEVGKQLLARHHRLPVGSKSVIGRVTLSGTHVIATANDTGVHARNELLPNTQAELALPLLDGDTVIGALDVQSTRVDAFTETDVQALQVMANQLATAIRNARLFAEQKNSVEENKRLLLDAEGNLREIQRLNRQLTQAAWHDFIDMNATVRGVTMQGTAFEQDATWSTTMQEASKRMRAITSKEGDEAVLAVPILLRGEVLGAIEIETDAEGATNDLIEMVESVAQRLAISLENARLFEEAQESTAQEQRVSAIGLRYQSAGSVDELLQITLSELRETLGAEGGSIRLGKMRPPATAHANGGSAS